MDQQPVAPQAPAPATAPASQPPASLPPIPESWPGAWGLYKYSKQIVLRNWGVLLTLFVFNILLGSIGRSFNTDVTLLLDIVSVGISVATFKVYISNIQGRTLTLGNALASIKPMLVVKLIVNYIFLAISLAVAFILLIVPGVLLLPRIILAPYLVVTRELGPLKAIQASWDITKDNTGKVWGVIGATIAMALLMITIIGIPFALYFLFMYGAAFIILSEFLFKQQPAADVTAPVAPVVTAPAAPVESAPASPTPTAPVTPAADPASAVAPTEPAAAVSQPATPAEQPPQPPVA